MDHPFALFLTWTCYGTWLPGDPRGYVGPTFDPAETGRLPKENIPGTPYRRDHEATLRRAREQQKQPTFLLDRRLALVAARSFCDACRERGWRLLRGAVMANHVHLLIADCPNDGPTVRRVVKGVSQARLNDADGANRRRWTAGGSDRYLNDDPGIDAVGRYIERQERQLARIVEGEVFEVIAGSPPG